MLHDYRTKEGSRLDVGWDGWLLSASMNSEGDAFGLHDQDYIHNGKKLINPLLSSVRCLQLGGDVCLLQHVGHVYNRFTVDEHGLRQEDIDRRDRQNWGSVSGKVMMYIESGHWVLNIICKYVQIILISFAPQGIL